LSDFHARLLLQEPRGRIWLWANADAYGYTLDESGDIVDDEGVPLDPDNETYQAIMERALEQVRVEGRPLSG
jgi:hypothetical protein